MTIKNNIELIQTHKKTQINLRIYKYQIKISKIRCYGKIITENKIKEIKEY